jgi:hypothetical protein
MANTKQTLFVIFASSQQYEAPRTCYIAQDGTTSMMRSKAARFYSFAEAKQFAKENHIKFNAHTYIGLEDFTDVEMQG